MPLLHLSSCPIQHQQKTRNSYFAQPRDVTTGSLIWSSIPICCPQNRNGCEHLGFDNSLDMHLPIFHSEPWCLLQPGFKPKDRRANRSPSPEWSPAPALPITLHIQRACKHRWVLWNLKYRWFLSVGLKDRFSAVGARSVGEWGKQIT